MKLIGTAAVCLLAGILFSCKTTKITSSWKADKHVTKPYHNVMVWNMLPEKDSALRRQIETHMVNDLVSKGYHAISSLDVYKEKAYQKLTPAAILDEFKMTGVDAVLSIALLSKENEERYYPGGYFTQPVESYGNLNQYYSNVFERVLMPGYYVRTTNYYWQSNLFEVQQEKLVYSARTRSFDPYSTDVLAHEKGLLIINDMIRKKIIIAPTLPAEE